MEAGNLCFLFGSLRYFFDFCLITEEIGLPQARENHGVFDDAPRMPEFRGVSGRGDREGSREPPAKPIWLVVISFGR